MSNRPNTFKEEFANFLEEPTRERLRDVLHGHLGEFPNLDFKREWPETSKLARHTLGLANWGGGCLIIGIGEQPDKTLVPCGLNALEDKASLDSQLRNFLPATLAQQLTVMDFSYTASEYAHLTGRLFQVLFVPDDVGSVPFLPVAETGGLRRAAVYVRRMASTEEANYEELQKIINRRIGTGHSTQNIIDLSKHVSELEGLYAALDRAGADWLGPSTTFRLTNPEYPRESLTIFLARMIELKKFQIEAQLQQPAAPI